MAQPTDMRRDRHVKVETDIYNEGLAAGIADKPSVAPEIYPYLSNDWQSWMGGHANGTLIMNTMTQLRQALALAEPALDYSEPKMKLK